MIEPGLWDMIMRLRSRGISDSRLTRALELAPRSRFVADRQRERAYEEGELPLPCGQTMLSPLATAQILQLADIGPDTKVLVVGLGSGYLAGLAAKMSRRVFAVERYAELLALGESNLARASARVTARWGDGRYGWKANAPFDRILVTAGLAGPPSGLLAQLADHGLLVAVIDGQLSVLTTGTVRKVLPLGLPPIEPGKSAAL